MVNAPGPDQQLPTPDQLAVSKPAEQSKRPLTERVKGLLAGVIPRIKKEDPDAALRIIAEYELYSMFPLSDHPDPKERVKAQAIVIEEPSPEVAVNEAEEIIKTYQRGRNADKEHDKQESKKVTERAAELKLHDMQVQEALYSPDEPIQQILQKVAMNISKAEEQVLSTDELSSRANTADYRLFLTKRDNINAFTYKGERIVFVEAGFLTLFDKFLRQSKGYSLAEDHIAALVGHEVSHSDKEAETRYQSEEYCDVQGMKLVSYAGYNPNAALDLTDFMIWLDGSKGSTSIPFLSSHPNSKNRRVVLANELKNKDIVLPNQSAVLTPVADESVRGMIKNGQEWQERNANKILVKTRDEVIQNIREAKNLSELLDALTGYKTIKQAEAIREFAQSPLTDKATVIQAILAQLRANDNVVNVSMPGGISRDGFSEITDYHPKQDLKYCHYAEANILMGGISRGLSEPKNADISTEALRVADDAITALDNLKIEAGVPVPEDWNIVEGKTIPSDSDEGEKLKQAMYSKKDSDSQILTQRVTTVIDLMGRLNRQIDIPKFLSGDFSQYPELSKQLQDLGITHFKDYLNFLQKNFIDLQLSHVQQQIASDRTLAIYPDSSRIGVPNQPWSQQNVRELLEETRYFRAAPFLDVIRRQNDLKPLYQGEWDTLVRSESGSRLQSFAAEITAVPQEQVLLKEMFLENIYPDYMHSFRVRFGQQFCSSTIMKYLYRDDPHEIVDQYQSPGLSQSFKDFRIAPISGGYTLGDLIEQSSHTAKPRVPSLEYLGQTIGKEIDYVKLNFGRASFEQQTENREYTYVYHPSDLDNQLAYLQHARQSIPTYDQGYLTKAATRKFSESVTSTKSPQEKLIELKRLAEAAEFEVEDLRNIVLLTDISVEEKTGYLKELLYLGKTDIEQVTKALNSKEWYGDNPTHFNFKMIEEQKMRYSVGIDLLKSLPTSPMPFRTTKHLAIINDFLFESKIRLEKINNVFARDRQAQNLPSDYTCYIGKENLYEGMNEQQATLVKLNRLFEFAKEGGTVSIYPLSKYIKGLLNCGVGGNTVPSLRETGEADMFNLLVALDFPVDLVKKQVSEILEQNKDRFSPAEKDKWVSLMALCEQPGFYQESGFGSDSNKIPLKTEHGYEDLEFKGNVDNMNKFMQAVERLPESTYRDFCLERLVAFYPSVVYKDLTPDFKKADLDKHFWPFIFRNFSQIGLINQPEFNKDFARTFSGEKSRFLPGSERYLTDVPAGFYVQDSSAREVMYQLIEGNIKRSDFNMITPLAADYRAETKFAGRLPESTERTIMYERLRLIQELPTSDLKEGLMLYSLQTAFDNLSGFPNGKLLRGELMTLIESYREQFQGDQARDRLFEMEFRLLTDCLSKPLTKETVASTFNSRGQYFDYMLARLPDKSSFRDGFIVLGVEAFPMKVSEAISLSNIMFANDYATQMDSRVGSERTGMEFVRSVKQRKDVTEADISDLVLWMADEKRQTKTIDDFILRLSNDQNGRQMIKRSIEELNYFQSSHMKLEYRSPTDRKAILWAAQTASKVFGRLPIPVKRLIVNKILQHAEQRDIYKLYRVGLPPVLQKMVEEQAYTVGIGENPATFNSMLESFTEDNPSRKQIFFDLVLGEKGPLEEPTLLDPQSFTKRFEQGFKGSEMHRFIDQILEMSFRNSSFDQNAKRLARVASHAYLEGLSPVRRATVLQNLLTEFPKIDFTEPNPQKLQAKVFAVALSAMGLLGAKIGQIDELVPPQFRREVVSLKHGTKPMNKLMVADIFRQEGLSGDYTIIDSAGAASTACGYIVENPNGEKQFTKIIRPEVVQEWQGDFRAVRYMIECLRANKLLNIETTPVLNQLQRLVEQELNTKHEVDNVVSYIAAEAESGRVTRQGLRAVKMPLERFTNSGAVSEQPKNSVIIFEELLDKNQFIELSKMEGFVEKKALESVYTKIIEDFLYRSIELGSWHTDLHGGNILVSREGVVKRAVGDEDMVLIDFGQTGSTDEQFKKQNAARFLVGLGLGDRSEVAKAIFEAIPDKNGISLEQIKSSLPIRPGKLQESLTKVMTQYQIEEYLTNFMKASINVLPYFGKLSLNRQFDLLSPYIPDDMKKRLRTRLIQTAVTAAGRFGI